MAALPIGDAASIPCSMTGRRLALHRKNDASSPVKPTVLPDSAFLVSWWRGDA
jgi:hypothetical protein